MIEPFIIIAMLALTFIHTSILSAATSAEWHAAGGQPAADVAASDSDPDGQRLELQIRKPLLQPGEQRRLGFV